MANRLTKITTRTGDDGSTGLADGSRVAKHSLRVEVIGEIDELNSAIGAILGEPLSPRVKHILTGVQHDLFDLGGDISLSRHPALKEAHLTRLDELTAALNTSLPPLKEFILPGGSRAAALTHVARAVCRRAERRLCQLAEIDEVSGVWQKYLNRLSDVLFQLSRIINRDAGVADVYWQPGRDLDI